jgi:hypothetical protein
MYVDSTSTSRQVSDFASRYDTQALFVVTSSLQPTAIRSITSVEPAYVAIYDDRVPLEVAEELSNAPFDLVRISDPYRRKVRNSDYPNEEFFSDAHIRIASDPLYNHFGDYSIVGDAYTEGGGAAYTVALHHIVAASADSDRLDIKHYKSDFSETTADVAGKFLEALDALIVDQQEPDPRNDTMALGIYRNLAAEEHFPGLGFAKKLGLMQHFEVVANILDPSNT